MKQSTKKLYVLAGLFVVLMVCTVGSVSGQIKTNDLYVENQPLSQYKESIMVPLSNVLEKVEQTNHITFLYQPSLIDGKKVSKTVLTTTDLAHKIGKLLAQNGLTYEKQAEGVYVIKRLAGFHDMVQPAAASQVNGTVTDGSTGKTLPGVNIRVKGTTTGTSTDGQGQYELTVESLQDTLVFSFVGYQTRQAPIDGRTEINVEMQSQAFQGKEMVVIGYGAQQKRDLTGSISSVTGQDINDLNASRADQALLGKVAGAQVKPVSGAPGAAPQIRIRGTGSISAGVEPLYVVDGAPVEDIQSIDTQNIQSINVLKGASASAIYGSRGSNGVIIIETKEGTAGETKFNIDVSGGFQQVTNTPNYMNAKQQANWAYYGVINRNHDLGYDTSGPPTTWQFPMPQRILDVRSGANTTDVNAVKRMMRTAPKQNYRLTASGGSEKIQYYISGQYLDQEGIIKNTGFKRYSVRAKMNAQLTDRFNLQLNLNPSFTKEWGLNPNGTGYGTSILGNAASINPYVPLRNDDGSYYVINNYPAVGDFPNPLALVNEVVAERPGNGLTGNLIGTYDILDELNVQILLNGDLSNNRSRQFVPDIPSLLRTSATGSDYSTMRYKWLTEYTLNYQDNFGNHNLNGVVGFTAKKAKIESNSLSSNKFPNNLVSTLSGTGGLISDGYSDIGEYSLVSYLGRLNYNYDHRYYLTAAIRRDGSSRFGKKNKYGNFPSVGLAWNISNEEFLQDAAFLSNLKIRGSFGKTGNNNIGNYQQYSILNNVLYPLGNNAIGGIIPGRLSNPSLTWEKKEEFDGGIDASFFNSRLSFTVDYYHSINRDLLLNVNIPEITGFDNTFRNIGKVKNTGWEFELSTRNLSGTSFQWTTDFNLSTNRNEVLELGPKGDPIINQFNITKIGQPLGMFYGLLTDGIFETEEELNEGPIYNPGSPNRTHVGDTKFKDLSGPNGKPDGIINSYDKTIMGSPYPDFYYGMTNRFSYKNLSLSISIQGVNGSKILSDAKRVHLRGEFRVNQLALFNDFWKSESEPGDGYAPRPNDEPTGGVRTISERFLDYGSYLRINNISLSYNLPQKIVQNLNVNSLQLYINASRPFIFTKNKSFNPDVSDSNNPLTPGIDRNDYPLAKSYIFGVRIGL